LKPLIIQRFPNRKKRAIRSAEKLHELIASLQTTEQEAITKTRIGQGYFRDLLIDKYSCKCALCDIETKNMLIASHIKEWAESSDDEKLDENNGLLLCVHHDALFDKHLISFDDNGNLIVSSQLSPTECTHLGINAIPKLTVTAKMKPYLAIHRSKVK
jgi:predicted restriction endonuclease